MQFTYELAMASIFIGPSLAQFPAFPDPNTVDPTTLNFVITDQLFSFEINGYRFEFSGDFSTIPDPKVLNFFAALDPTLPLEQVPRVTITGSQVTAQLSGDTAIGFTGAAATLPVNVFFGTLLDPRNFTDDIITAFFGDITQFNTLDLSAFRNGVFMGAPNAAVISPDGVIGVSSFESELDGFLFSQIVGSRGADRLFGNALDNTMQGRTGADILFGGEGADTLQGNQGPDILEGGLGADWVQGGQGHDLLLGEAGDDTLQGESGRDVLAGGAGRNQLVGGRGADTFILSDENNQTLVTDFNFREGDRLDTSLVNVQSNLVSVALGEQNHLTLIVPFNGAEGKGTVSLVLEDLALEIANDESPPSNFRLPRRFAEQVLQVITVNKSRKRVFGSVQSEQIQGTRRANRLLGNRGDDVIQGRQGNDFMSGGDDNDRLFGGQGVDVIVGGAGKDSVLGGNGDDLLFGGEGPDVLRGNRGNDVLDGGDGHDLLVGGRGSNTLTGGTLADTFKFTQLDGMLDRVTDFEVGFDKLDLSRLLSDTVTAETLTDFIQVTSPGPTELTRFLAIDVNGAVGGSTFVPLLQIDDVTDAQLFDIANYIV